MPLSDRRRSTVDVTPDYPLIARALAATRHDLAPEHWHKGAPAVDAQGRETELHDCKSIAWCVQGILLRHVLTGSNATIRAAIHLLHRTASRLSGGRFDTLFAFNDDPATTATDIDRLLAVALAEAESLAFRPSNAVATKANQTILETVRRKQPSSTLP